jgi:hypothetical protein
MRLALLCVLWIGAGHVSPSLPEPIYEAREPFNDLGVIPDNLFWLPDSRHLLFASVVFSYEGSEELTHFVYDVQSGLRVPVERSPFTVRLTSAQQEHFRAAGEEGYFDPGSSNFVYLSTFDTYLHFEGLGYWKLYAAGSLTNKAFIPLPIANTFMLSGVMWSEDGSTLVIGADHYHGGLKSLIHVRQEKYCNGTFCDVEISPMIPVDGSETLFDLSADGTRALIPQGGVNPNLLLWDVQYEFDPSSRDYSSLIVWRGETIGAAFIPDDNDHILIVTEQGIVRYSLSTGESEVINAEINSTWASWAVFSPDNRWAAVLAGEGIARERLYVLPV